MQCDCHAFEKGKRTSGRYFAFLSISGNIWNGLAEAVDHAQHIVIGGRGDDFEHWRGIICAIFFQMISVQNLIGHDIHPAADRLAYKLAAGGGEMTAVGLQKLLPSLNLHKAVAQTEQHLSPIGIGWTHVPVHRAADKALLKCIQQKLRIDFA